MDKTSLEKYAKQIDREILKREMIKAAQDPLFMADVKEIMEAFAPVDDEKIGENKKW